MPATNKTYTLPSNYGTCRLQVVDGKGIIDDAAKTAFTRGHCHSFAFAMHELTGWPIVGVGCTFDSPNHTVVYCPELNDFVDVGGTGAIKREFGGFKNPIIYRYDDDPDIVLNFYDYREPKVDTAMPFAETVVSKLKKKIIARRRKANANKCV